MRVLYEAGYGLTSIGTRYNITAAAVSYHLKKQGVHTRPRGSRLPFRQIHIKAQRVRDRELIAVDTENRRHQICAQCGAEYSNTNRWTVICGKKRCRQQREYHNRINDPVRAAKLRTNGHNAYLRRRTLLASA
jgi:hypothetical protein